LMEGVFFAPRDDRERRAVPALHVCSLTRKIFYLKSLLQKSFFALVF
jgi:hypothetical protein